MIRSDRVRELLEARGLSQSELARRVNVTQGAIAKIVSRNPGGSAHLHKIARVLRTSPAYLTGETDDPDEDAPPPLPPSAVQHLLMRVALPSEAALTAAYKGLLLASREMDEDELAHELAMQLPTMLRVAEGAVADLGSVDAVAPVEAVPGVDDDRPEPRRARRR